MTIESQIASAVVDAVKQLLDDLGQKVAAMQVPHEGYNPDKLYTDVEAATLLNISVVTLRQWRTQKKEIPFVKLGSSARYRAKDIRAYLDRETMKVLDDKGRVRG